MQIDVTFDATGSDGRAFLTWRPQKLTIRRLPSPDNNTTIILENKGPVAVRFSFDPTDDPDDTFDDPFEAMALDLPMDGSPREVWVMPKFQSAGSNYGDTIIQITDLVTNDALWTQDAMVRIRKNANDLTNAERDKFLNAMAVLNDSGRGRFSDFRDMHTNRSNPEAHGDVGFLPWHRAYITDLERELQLIDPEVALPYWRFDEAAPNLFTRDFIGLPDSTGWVQFTPGHPFENWTTDGQIGILRQMTFQPWERPPTVLSEDNTLAMGGMQPNAAYANFIRLEGNPHGAAHVRFRGFVSSIHTAAKDPLFFMLHCNVDRLWAKWQWLHERTDINEPLSFALSRGNRIGHRLPDTMWPWNGDTNTPRPPTAPGGGMASSTATPFPGPNPRVEDMMDYQALHGQTYLGFDYDDVPAEITAGMVGSGGIV